ncbi:MAG: sugar phosphate isomerase/epimerase [Acidobacteria bacterium]|nr:sugar phosphate isomerase/epimerase [Acidobacteriota bacterium]
MTRRIFLSVPVAAAAGAAPAMPPLCIFSKHLAGLNYDQLGKVSKDLGFDGVDLAVRPGGHVLPAQVTEGLPRAFEAIHGHGVSVPMITTALTRSSDPAARPTLSTAGRLKIGCFKTGYEYYRGVDLEKKLAEVKEATRGLAEMAREYGIALGFHNHSGDYVGAPVWDTREILAGLDPKWAGYYFDPGHATVEGGLQGWALSLRMALPRIKMVAVKDFVWEKSGGKWKVKWAPLGEGMVDWPAVFGMLAKARFPGPVSLHLEYQAADERAAMAKDLEYLRKQVRAAYLLPDSR